MLFDGFVIVLRPVSEGPAHSQSRYSRRLPVSGGLADRTHIGAGRLLRSMEKPPIVRAGNTER